METENNLPAVISPETFAIIEAMPDALRLNNEITSKAISAGKALLDKISSDGMTDELDQKANAYIIRAEERLKEMYERRQPATKMFDEIKSRFTELENKLSRKKENSITSLIQAERNKYATYKAEEQRKKDEEIRRKQLVEKAKIDLLAEAKVKVVQEFEKFLDYNKRSLQGYFDNISLTNHREITQKLNDFKSAYTQDDFSNIGIDIKSSFLKWEEILIIKDEAKLGKFDEFSYRFTNELDAFREDLLKKVPGKIKYLEDLQKADAERRELMLQQEAQRKIEEEERLERARIQAEELAKAKAEEEKQAAILNQSFNEVAEIAENTSENNAIESWEIKVLKPAGWVMIFQKWFEKDGITKENAAIEKKSLGQMKAFCEKLYTKEQEKIDSPFLEYVPVYTVRAKK